MAMIQSVSQARLMGLSQTMWTLSIYHRKTAHSESKPSESMLVFACPSLSPCIAVAGALFLDLGPDTRERSIFRTWIFSLRMCYFRKFLKWMKVKLVKTGSQISLNWLQHVNSFASAIRLVICKTSAECLVFLVHPSIHVHLWGLLHVIVKLKNKWIT